MLRGKLTDPKFRAELSDAIKPNAHYMTTLDYDLHPFEVVIEKHIIRMGFMAWASWGHSKREQTTRAYQNN